MIVDKYTTTIIRLSQEEYLVLESACDILRKINREVDNSDADEIRLSDDTDKDLLSNLNSELTELGYTVDF